MSEIRKKGGTLIILILGSLMAVSPFAIDLYLPAFAQIAKDLATTPAKVSLSVSSYMVGIAVGQLFWGPLLDRYGRKKPLYFGLTVFILCCIGCMESNTVGMLLVFRFIQALGGCVALTAAITMVRDFFPAKESARILSMMMLILGLSPLLAPTAGGFITAAWGWHWVFIILALLVSAILTNLIYFLPHARDPDPTVSLKLNPMVKTFVSILKNRQFFTYSVSGSFSFALMFLYVAGSPVVFMGILHVTPQAFGGIFALLAVAFIGSNQVNILLLRKYSSELIYQTAIWSQIIITLVFLIGAWNGWLGLTGTMVMYFLCLASLGLTYPNASALALQSVDTNFGSASALIGFLQIGVAGLASTAIGLINLHSITPVPAMMLISSLIALGILLTGKRKLPNIRYTEVLH